MITFNVLGTPAPKGSARAFVNKRTGRAILAPSGSKANQDKIEDWNSAVRLAARAAIGRVTVPPFVALPLIVTIKFRMARPGGHWAKGKNAGKLKPNAPRLPTSKPDIDKLARTTLDCLTAIVIDDDSRIVGLMLSKAFAAPGDEGATITVEEIAAQLPKHTPHISPALLALAVEDE